MDLFDLSGRVAVVTGGNGGIGLGMARGLAQAGAAVAVAARSRKKGEAAVADLAALGAAAAFVSVDVTNPAAVAAMVSQTLGHFGRLDVLVNNAGVNLRRPPQDYTLEQWHWLVDTNLTSAFLCAQAVHPAMQRAGGGKIINVGSMFSLFGAAHAVVYGATKGGIVQLTKGLAVAWAPDGIQVNAILPGWIDTDLTRAARADVPRFHDRIVGRTPADRWGRPDDVAGVAVFLASPASDFITGAAIPVDGGYAAQG